MVFGIQSFRIRSRVPTKIQQQFLEHYAKNLPNFGAIAGQWIHLGLKPQAIG
jgi:hypothetical protein